MSAWRNETLHTWDKALAEVDERYVKADDEVSDHELVYNGGDRRYDELYTRYVSEENIQ